MKFEFKKLGPLYQGEIELADLTVICGENNTGKTYITYALYGLFRSWRRHSEFEPTSQELDALEETGLLKIDLRIKLAQTKKELKERLASNFQEHLPELLAAKSNSTLDTRIKLDFIIGEQWQEKEFFDETRSEKGKLLLSINKLAKNGIVEITAAREDNEPIPRFALSQWIESALLNIVLGDVFPSNAFLASTERTGAVIFKEELNLTQNRLLDLITQEKDVTRDIHPGKLFDTVYKQRRYAIPVKDNVDFVNQLGSLENEESALIKEYPEIFDSFLEILGGTFKTSKEGTTYFTPNSNKQLKLTLSEASSSVRSLLLIAYYLRHIAKRGDWFMIDEPELNLHPVNQRRFARFISMMVNSGIKVFMTTHSDYIIKELNSLIMFHQDLPHYASIKQKFGYKADEKLDPKKVKLYMTGTDLFEIDGQKRKKRLNTLSEAKIDPKYGIAVQTFDKSIEQMNEIQERIVYGD